MVETSEAYLVPALLQAARRMGGELARLLDPHGVTVDQWRILDVLADGEGRTMGDLADTAGLTGPTLTKAVDRLVERGLVYRRQDDVDRRRVVCLPAPDGQRLLLVLQAEIAAQQQQVEQQLGVEDAAALMRLLQALTRTNNATAQRFTMGQRP